MKEKINKKPLIFILFLLTIGAIGYTIAYYTSENSYANDFKTMTYNVVLEEEFNNDWGTKKVYVKNIDVDTNVPVVLRLNYNETWTNNNSTVEYVLNNEINGQEAAIKNWTSTFTNNFFLGDDGWYYYRKVLNPGDTIQILQSIEKNNTLINNSPYRDDYHKSDYNLSFNYEAIQATESAVKDIWNKIITINGSDVEWE